MARILRFASLLILIFAVFGWNTERYSKTLVSGKIPQLQCLDGELAQRMEESKKNEWIPIFILFEHQAKPYDFPSLSQSKTKNEIRNASIIRLKELSDKTFKDFSGWLKRKGHHKKVRFKGRFWLVNGVKALATAKTIRQLSLWDGISRVYLRTEKPALMIKTDKKFTRLNMRSIPDKDVFKGPFLTEGKEIPWNLKNIRADAAWAQGFTGRGVTIAILDSGVNYSHPDIRNNLWVNADEIPENGLDDDKNGYVDDIIGWNFAEENKNVRDNFFHGSESAGILVGDGTAGLIAGVAPQANLMILKTYAYDKSRQYGGRYLWQAFQYDKWLAFEYALENGAQVASLSFDYQPSEKPLFAPWRFVLANASYCGLTVVAGAGNSRSWLKTPHQVTPPANVPEVIAVGGTDEMSRVDRVSSRGPVTWESVHPFNDYPLPEGLTKPDVSAPVGRYPLIHWSSDGYKYHTKASGTSLSAPHVAGVAALMLEKDSELMPAEIKKRLEETCMDIGHPGKDNYSGWGLVDAHHALDYGLYPKINLAGIIIDDGQEYYIRNGQSFRLRITLRVSASTLNSAKMVISCPNPEILFEKTEIELRPQEPILSGQTISIDLLGQVSDAIDQCKKVFCNLSVAPDKGRKFHFRFSLYVGEADILLVDDDGEGQKEHFIFEALERSGRPYHYLDLHARKQDLDKCLKYTTVIWITGEEFTNTLDITEQNVLLRLLNAGGNLILIGDNIGDDIGSTSFYKNYLHAKIIKDRIIGNYSREKPYMILGKSGDSLSQRLAIPAYTYYKQYDLIRPLEDADDPFEGQDEDNYLGFVRFAGPYKLLYTSMGMESIEDISVRAELFDRILTWMEN